MRDRNDLPCMAFTFRDVVCGLADPGVCSQATFSANMGSTLMQYQVKAVPDTDLPAGTDWAIVRVPEGVYLFVKRSRFACESGMCELLAEAWRASATYRAGVPAAPLASAV